MDFVGVPTNGFMMMQRKNVIGGIVAITFGLMKETNMLPNGARLATVTWIVRVKRKYNALKVLRATFHVALKVFGTMMKLLNIQIFARELTEIIMMKLPRFANRIIALVTNY